MTGGTVIYELLIRCPVCERLLIITVANQGEAHLPPCDHHTVDEWTLNNPSSRRWEVLSATRR